MSQRWMERLNADPLPWLLERDLDNPGVRYFALRDLLDGGVGSREFAQARREVMISGPVPLILDAMAPEGYWVKPGPGYSPKYRSTVWQIIALAMLGADGEEVRVRKACDYLLTHSRSEYGGFSVNGKPAYMVHCLQGNLAAAMIDLGWLGDERLMEALDWLARSITGRDIAPAEEFDAKPRYHRSGNSGPGFVCAINDHLPCAWGAVKAIIALGKVPGSLRTPAIEEALEEGRDFLLSRDPAIADYPMGYGEKPSRRWFQLELPLSYVADFLQNLEAITSLGVGDDPRLSQATDLLLSKQDAQGRWKMEYSYKGKTWVDIEKRGKPSKWITLRALRVLKRIYDPAVV